jgi:alcohol dehydrogenase (cytochrome c)
MRRGKDARDSCWFRPAATASSTSSIATTEQFLLGKPFVSHLTWAREIGPDGRPVLMPGQEPSVEGSRVCPSAHGAANWYSTSYSPQTGLYYVQTLENCNVFVKSVQRVGRRKIVLGRLDEADADAPNQKILRAIDVKTGKDRVGSSTVGAGRRRGGTLATASGLLFFCDDQDRFGAVDASTGKVLWQFGMNSVWRASPMTYQFDGQQYVAIASGSNIVSFGLVN